jgi:hypothetical protein
MRSKKHLPRISSLIIAFFVMLFRVQPAHAMDQVSIENVQAAMRTLSFLESLPKAGPIVVGVVYPSDIPNAQAAAEATAELIGTMRGPNSRALQPLVIATNALAQFQGHLDVLFLMVGASRHSTIILDFVLTRNAV